MLAMLCFKYRVTGDASARDLALEAWDAAHLLLEGSGYEGMVARSFGKRPPESDEYVFNRDGSGDGLAGWMFGMSFAVKLLRDPVREKRTAADLRKIVRHLLKHGLVIHMDERAATRYGDFNTPVLGVPIGHYAMPMMALASLALRLNPGDHECARFLDYLVQRGYPEQTRYFYAWFPHAAFNSNVYVMNAVTALSNDPDYGRRLHYQAGLESFWDRTCDWQMAFFGLCYKHLGGRRRPELIGDSIARLRNLPLFRNRLVDEGAVKRRRAGVVPIEDRPMGPYFWSKDVFKELTSQEGPREPVEYCRLDFLIAYWFGRYMGEY